MKPSLMSRYISFALALALMIVAACLLGAHPWAGWAFTAGVLLTAIGCYDLLQVRRSVTRNYPIIGHIRYLVEMVRPEIRQYLLEGDDEKLPFSRAQRALVYARAKNHSSEKAFGTLQDVYRPGYEFMNHALGGGPEPDPDSFRIIIGNEQCRVRYCASIFNISAMSFGSLSANAIRALNKGAKRGGFAHDTGEGSISPYHQEYGGDLIWEIGSGYFGCRTESGAFNPARFQEQARLRQVRMIEVKLSQGAKPGHGGILPGHKVSTEIASTRGVPAGEDCISPARHSAFSTPLEFIHFLARLRALSGGKPVGFKLCIGHPWEFMAIAKAMLETGVYPDFIVVDGNEGGTGAAPREFTDNLGMPLREGLLFVHNTLVGLGIRHKLKIGASGKIISAFDIACMLSLGADWVNAARGFLFAIGCIQSQSCNTNTCPTGVATQDPLRQRALEVGDKAQRVYNFHRNTLHAMAELLAAAGLSRPTEIEPKHLVRRLTSTEIRLFSQLHTFLQPGELLAGTCTSDFYNRMWSMANSESFGPSDLPAASGSSKAGSANLVSTLDQ